MRLLAKPTYGNGNFIDFTYDNLDRITEKKYNDSSTNRATYLYGADGSLAQTVDFSVGTRTQFTYDLADRLVSQKEYATTAKNGGVLRSSTDFTYADKTNYLTGIKHFSPLGTQTIGYTYGNIGLGQMPDQIYKVSWNGQEKVNYTYDTLGRLTNKSVIVGGGVPDAPRLNTRYTYVNAGENKTTTLVNSVQTAAGTFTYTYDEVGNIKTVSDGTYTTSYDYDSLNQLVRENNQQIGKTYTYAYQNGNITERKEYAYTTGELPEQPQCVYSWSYDDDTWGDLLTDFNGIQITYDEIGNPTAIGEAALSWDGRQLKQVVDGGNTYSYAYNIDGQRVSKTVTESNGTVTTTEYFYNGSILAGQKTGEDTLVFMYDDKGTAFGFTYNGTEYYYLKNAQGDVDAVVDSNRQIVAKYAYDAWGKVISVTDADGVDIWDYTHIGHINPIRYRGYYYDQESNFYYLNSRYYAPDICRFLNADAFTQTGQGMLDKNMFAYCGNNPVNRSDLNGNKWADVKQWFSDKWNRFTNWVDRTFGTTSSTIVSISSGSTFETPSISPVYVKMGTDTTVTTTSTKKTSKPVTLHGTYNKLNPLKSSVSLVVNDPHYSTKISLSLDDIGVYQQNTIDNTTTFDGVKLNLSNLTVSYVSGSEIKWDNQAKKTYVEMGFCGYTPAAVFAYVASGQTKSVPQPRPQPQPA